MKDKAVMRCTQVGQETLVSAQTSWHSVCVWYVIERQSKGGGDAVMMAAVFPDDPVMMRVQMCLNSDVF